MGMFASAEDNGFSALCSSEESPKVALMGAMATGLAFLFGRMSSRSRSETDDRSPEEIAEDEQVLMKQDPKDPRWLYVKDLKSPVDGLRQLRKASKLSKSPLLTKWVMSSSWPKEWEEDPPGWMGGIGTYVRLKDPRSYIPDSAQIKVVRGLLEDGVAPEALLYATHYGYGNENIHYQQHLDEEAKHLDDVARQIDRKVAPVSRQEDRLRVASAISDLSGGAEPSYTPEGFYHMSRGEVVMCALRPISEDCRKAGATGSLSYEPFVAALPGAAHVEAARLASGEALERVYEGIPRKLVVQRLARLPRISAQSFRSEILQNECNKNLELVPDDLKPVFSSLGQMVGNKPKVAQWLQGVCKDRPRLEALFIERKYPYLGRLEKYKIFDRINYIGDRDIEGLNESVTKVFDRARKRHEREDLERCMGEDLDAVIGRIPSWWPNDTIEDLRGKGFIIKQLVTPRQLLFEGRDMRHCVGEYCKNVRSGESYIVSMSSPEGIRSTVEFDCDGSIEQHKGYGDSRPKYILFGAVKDMEKESKDRYRSLPELERRAICDIGKSQREDDDDD